MTLSASSDLPPDLFGDFAPAGAPAGPGGTVVLWDLPRTLAPPAALVADAHREAFERLIGRPPSAPPDLALVTDPRIAVGLMKADGMTSVHAARVLPRLLPELTRCFAERIERHLPDPPSRRLTLLLDDIASTNAQGVVSGALRPNVALWLNTVGLRHVMSDAIGGYGSDHASPGALLRLACTRARDRHGEHSKVVVVSTSTRGLDVGAACGASPIRVDPRRPGQLVRAVRRALRTARPAAPAARGPGGRTPPPAPSTGRARRRAPGST